jgi:hypothetical protein
MLRTSTPFRNRWWNWTWPDRHIDAEFDEPDVAADHDLICAITAGRAGLHPDGWGNHAPVPLFGSSRLPKLEPKYSPPVDRKQDIEQEKVDRQWEARHRRRPLEPSPIKRPRRRKPRLSDWTRPVVPGGWAGELRLTCDECGREAFPVTLLYAEGQREAMVTGLRALGGTEGWTYLDGWDRCPRCTRQLRLKPPAPKAKGNGTGAGEGHEQNTNGGQ